VTAVPEIFVTLGSCDDMRAEVYVRPAGHVPLGSTIAGSLTGPRRGRDTTLPVTSRLVPLSDTAATGPASRAILTEPAFWTPDLPNLYRVEARLEPQGGDPWTGDAWIGLRRLGIRGRSFWLDGRRWVPRVVVGSGDLAAAKEAEVGLATESPADDLLARADEIGVAVVSLLDAGMLTAARIAAIACHPSAMLAVLAADVVDELANRVAAVRSVKGTLLLGMAVDGSRPPPAVAEGADFLVLTLPAHSLPHDGWRSLPPRPLVAWRTTGHVTVAGGRAACAALQRDLALWGLARGDAPPWDWAGYLVG
jgi:hypothetical protein